MFGKTVGNGFALGVQRGQDEAGRGEAATRLFVGKCGSLQKIYNISHVGAQKCFV